MDIPTEVLEVLKCSRCETYLSRGHIFLQHDGAAVCNGCFAPERPAVRNTQYEATARLLKFPCKYRELGCLETVPYVGEDEEIAHEEVCEYRHYVCPVFGFSNCDWLGTRQEILQHCKIHHPDNVVDNPKTFFHDISKSSIQIYLLTAFQVLFLLYTKVCLKSGKIFHSVRVLGGSKEAANYHFTVDIKHKKELISKEGQVASQGCLAIQEPTSLALDTNSLLNVLGGFHGTSFTVTVKSNASDFDEIALRTKRLSYNIANYCTKCEAEVTVYLYADGNGWRCKDCAPIKHRCSYHPQGCTYTDTRNKSTKHVLYFCQFRTKCSICNNVIPRGSLSAHYVSLHQNITYRAGCTWRATPANSWQRCFVASDAGTAVCTYKLDEDALVFCVHLPMAAERLYELNCELKVTSLRFKRTRTYKTDILYDDVQDWHFMVQRGRFEMDDLDICVYINKINCN